MFGAGFKHMDSNESLSDGNYRAKIVSAELKKGSYGDYIQGTIEVDGKQVYPNLFFIKDAPTSGFGNVSKEQAHEMWCKNMTKFFASFGITEGDFEPSHWIGKEGDITVQQQKNKPEYKEIVMWKKTPAKTEQKAGPSPKAEGGEQFAEDIPF